MQRRSLPWLATLVLVALLASACRATPETTLMLDTSELRELATDSPFGSDTAESVPQPSATTDEPTTNFDRGGRGAASTMPDEQTVDLDSRPADSPERSSPLDDPSSNNAKRPASNNSPGGEIDFTLQRTDIDCDEDTLNDFPGVGFTVAHVVVDGNLGAPCFGVSDERLLVAWRVLAQITPPGQLNDLGLFGGYESNEPDGTTLAFVNTLDAAGSLYQMSINLQEAESDPDELMLTMAHEFAHVFTSLSTQTDRGVRISDCDTFHNTEGCFYADSLMYAWIERFWGNGLINEIDPWESPTSSDGAPRCSINPSFLGSYAASNPEEDFAETFSAFVFQLEVESPELQEKMDWFTQQPGLVEFRDRAIAAGLGPLGNFFERCG